MTRRHASADRQRAHSAGQQKITHYCSCVRAFTGNAAWWSHTNAHPDHLPITSTEYFQRRDDQDGAQR